MYLNDFELFISQYFAELRDLSNDIHLSDDDIKVFSRKLNSAGIFEIFYIAPCR